MYNARIESISGETRESILTTLRENISPNSNWKHFANKIETLLLADWLNERIIQSLENKNDASQPPEMLFRMWRSKNSYTVDNLIMILKSMGHEELISEIERDPKLTKSKRAPDSSVQIQEGKQATSDIQQLLDMGWDQKLVTEALSCNKDLNSAANWCAEQASKPKNLPNTNKDHRIDYLSIGVQGKILFELSRRIPGSDWKAFAAALQDLRHEDWISKAYPQIEYSADPPKVLFGCWSTRESYTVNNLLQVLKKMGHDMLFNLVRNDIAAREALA